MGIQRQNVGLLKTVFSKELPLSSDQTAGIFAVIRDLKEKFGASDLFAVEKDKSFHNSIGQIYQTFGGKELYPSVEEKAAMLLYLVVKNHSFIDGNKRIAESHTDEMETIVKVVVNLINRNNP